MRRWNSRSAFTLIELLVVIAVIGILIAILLPALSMVVESTRRMQCQGNMRQIGVAMTAFVADNGSWPAGSMSKAYTANPANPYQFYRWSALARITPYLQEYQVYQSLNFDVPLYNGLSALPTAENSTGVNTYIGLFMCPSDKQASIDTSFGPTNYAVSTGSGLNGGAPDDTSDGIFYTNSQTGPKDVRDGSANTVLMSESILGDIGNKTTKRYNFKTDYMYANAVPLTDAVCRTPFQYNISNLRGFSWANGEFRTTLYNHYYAPNAQRYDCIGTYLNPPVDKRAALLYTAYGWRTARSHHRGGVNTLFADGSVHFIGDKIDLTVWRGMGTHRSGEPNPGWE